MKNGFILSSLVALFAMSLFSCATVKERKKTADYSKGIYEINDGKNIDTQIHIERALYKLKSSPDNWRIKNNLMVLYRKKGNLEEAIKYGRQILHSDTKNYIALSNLAMVYYDMKNYKYAMYLLKKAISIYERDPGIHLNLGLVFLKKGELSLAEDEFLKAHKYDRALFPAIKNLGYFYYSSRNYDRAIKYLKKLVSIEPGTKHRNMLAISYRYAGDYKKAYKIYEEVLLNDKDNEVAIFNSAIIDLEYLNNPSLALEKFKKLKRGSNRSLANETISKLDEYINRAASLKMIEGG